MFAESMARREDGFSVAEVVIAAAIFFFVLTAMVGLIGASQQMSVMAKDRTTLTNVVAQYIDEVRALDYYQVATPPGGSVPLSEEVTTGPYTVRFTNRVVFPDGENGEYLRTVYVRAVCSIRGHTYRTSATVHIRNPKNDTTAASITDPDAPTVEFDSGTTEENAIVYGKLVYPDNPSIRLETTARSGDDVITEVKYLVGTATVRDDAGTLGTPALFPISPGTATASTQTRWDTLQAGVGDGLQKVVVQATDSRGRFGSVERQFVVDNVAPAPVSSLSASPITSTSSKINIGAAADPPVASGQHPITYAVSYPMTVRKVPMTGGEIYTWPVAYTGTLNAGTSYLDGMFNAGPLSMTITTEPFSRYRARVGARSPRGLSAARTTLFFVSSPETHSDTSNPSTCSTEYVKSGNNTTTDYRVSILIGQPTFPVDFSATTYKFSVRDDATSAWYEITPASGVTVTPEGEYWRVNFTYRETVAARRLWFKVGVNVTPTGESTPAGYVYSNAIGVAPLDTNRNSGTAVTGTLTPDSTWTR